MSEAGDSEIGDGLLWLVGFPRSGNTWIRFFLSHYANPQVADTLHAVDQDWRLWIDHRITTQVSGLSLADLPVSAQDETMTRVLPDLRRACASRCWLHSHDAYRRTPSGAPFIDAGVTRRIIHVVRNPLDVAVSLAAHLGIDHASAVERMLATNFDFVSADVRGAYLSPMRIGAWADHTRGWLDAPLPMHRVRYEDLLDDGDHAFAALVSAAGLGVDAEAMARAREATRFENLRRRERQPGFSSRRAHRAPAFRGGVAGQGQQRLAPELIAKVRAACGEVMEVLGYEGGL